MACLAELVASPSCRFDKSVQNTIVTWETAYGHNNPSIMIYLQHSIPCISPYARETVCLWNFAIEYIAPNYAKTPISDPNTRLCNIEGIMQ